MDKKIEVQQGKNIVDACKADNVKHLVCPALPFVEKLTNGALKQVQQFKGKAVVTEYAESIKGDMWVSYFMPGKS